MKALGRILVAMDLSGADYRLLEFLKLLAAGHPHLDADFLHVVHPVEIPVLAWALPQPEPAYSSLLNQLKVEIEEEVFAKLEDSPIGKNFEVVEGNITRELIKWVQQENIDLTLVGQKEHSLGSGVAASRFLRKSPSSVFFIPEYAGTNIDHILVPVDFSDFSAMAVETALELAHSLESKPEVTLLHIYDVPVDAHYRLGNVYSSAAQGIRENVEAYFPSFLSRFQSGDIKVTTRLTDNIYFDTSRNIANYARENMADLVVMGAKGHSRLSSLLLGSVTEKFLAYNGNIPVMVVR